MEPFRIVRDAVHGDIELTELECRVIDTPQFQRLRKVRQLGSSYLVFPSAVHTRFEHSLGTVAVAQSIIDNLNRKGNGRSVKRGSDTSLVGSQEETVVRLACLLHDVEHVPFGHTLEDDANLFERHDRQARVEHALGPDSMVGQILDTHKPNYRKDVLELLLHISNRTHPAGGLGLVRPWMVDLVGNTICADLLDYVRRDLYFCGIRDNYDDRILRAFELDAETDRLVIRLVKHGRYKRDIQSELLSILGLRYSLSEKVLYHHTKLAFDAMISKAVQAEGFGLEVLRQIDDLELIRRLAGGANRVARKIGALIETRGKYRPVFELNYDSTATVFPAGQAKSKLEELVDKYSQDPNASANRLRDEEMLENASGLEEGDVILNCLRRATNLKEAEVMVLWGGKATKLKDVAQDPPRGEVQALNTKYVALWRFDAFIHPDKYELFAVELERNVGKLVGTANVLRIANPEEWSRLDAYQEVFADFAKDKDLRLNEVDKFRRFALAEEVKARGSGRSTGEVFKAHLGAAFEAWVGGGRK